MVEKFKDILRGKRLILKRNLPTIETAKTMFKTIDKNRKHLRPWMIWEKLTLKTEDTMKYLFEKEGEFKAGKKVDYGIYLKKKYIGNIGIFNIDSKNKSAEIGYWISHSSTKKGYTTEAVKIIEKEFFEKIKLNRICIECDEKNKASAKTAIKCGYTLEGTRREDGFNESTKKFRSTQMYSKLKSEYKTKPI
jgi:ribosomal-protein-serine acetyltransferase